MATVFEARLIGNLGKDATVKNMERGIIAINFPVAHNKNWKDKKSGESKTRTTWINCTIWKKEDANMRILDFLKSGTLVELIGTPIAKSYSQTDGTIRSEIRLNVSKTNILRISKNENENSNNEKEDLDLEDLEDFFSDSDDF